MQGHRLLTDRKGYSSHRSVDPHPLFVVFALVDELAVGVVGVDGVGAHPAGVAEVDGVAVVDALLRATTLATRFIEVHRPWTNFDGRPTEPISKWLTVHTPMCFLRT
jgi:hypothetical protein